MKHIFRIIVSKFEHASIFAEVMNPWVAAHVKERFIEGSSAKISWGIRLGPAFKTVIPPFRCVEEHSLIEGMQVFLPVYKLLGKISFIRSVSTKILIMEK